MTIDRVATSQQAQYFLSQINKAGVALDATQTQIASGKVATTYAGFGDKAQLLQASLSAQARNTAYQSATTLAQTQADLQNTQLDSLASLAGQLQTAISNAVANNDGVTLMSQVQGLFDQATAILNSKDANGDYIYGGGKTDTPPVTVSSLSDLVSLPSISQAFANGAGKKAVQVADGESVTYGVTASDAATSLFQAFKDLAAFDASGSGDFAAGNSLTPAQSDFLTGEIATAANANTDLNTITAQNGYAYDRLQNAASQQGSLATLYSGFISNIQDTNMADAATQLSMNQTALQAALQVTASLNQLSLLNYLPISNVSG